MSIVPSFTFAGGVLSKSLWGRYDLTKYQTGLKLANNAVLSVEGGVEKRFGTYFTGLRKDQTKRSKLIPWRISDDDSYMLEFGDHYVRFMRFGGYVSIPGAHVPHADSIAVNVSGFMEVPTPWTAEEVWAFKYTFANDIMYIAHENYPPQQLRRLGLYDWSLVEQDFQPHPAWVGVITATYHDDTTVDDNYDAEPIQTKYKISATLADGIETLPSNTETVNADLGHRRTYVELDWPNYPGAIQYTIYKGNNGIFGFIGYATASTFEDRNYNPSYDVVPLKDNVEFPVDEWPRVIEFYKQRMAYASTLSKSQDIWLSRPLVFDSLRKSIPLQDDDAIQMSLVGRLRHTINHMVMLKKFLIFTDSAEWTLNTTENAALTAATADPIIETYYGAHPQLRPIPIGSRILFVQNKTGAVLDMGYEYTADAFKADDLTRLVRDLFQNKETVAWDYAVHPQNLLFAVMSDGTMNVMTYVREHEVWGWTTISTKGKFIDVACVTEINHEGVYVQVERVVNGVTTYFIERFEINLNNRIEDMVFSDCALTYVSVKTIDAVEWLSSEEIIVTITESAPSFGDLLRLEVSPIEYYIGEVTAAVGTNITLHIKNETKAFPEYLETQLPTAYLMTATITGLGHLEGETVSVLADGKVYKDLTIAAGQLTLAKKAARIHIGLPYTTRIETLDIDIDQTKGQFRHKTINEITLNLRNSRAVFVGVEHPDYPLDQLLNRNSAENMHVANSALNGPYELSPHISWGKTTEVVIESTDPLPMNILNIAPDIKYGSG
jgi:hypothetical protein